MTVKDAVETITRIPFGGLTPTDELLLKQAKAAIHQAAQSKAVQ